MPVLPAAVPYKTCYDHALCCSQLSSLDGQGGEDGEDDDRNCYANGDLGGFGEAMMSQCLKTIFTTGEIIGNPNRYSRGYSMITSREKRMARKEGRSRIK